MKENTILTDQKTGKKYEILPPGRGEPGHFYQWIKEIEQTKYLDWDTVAEGVFVTRMATTIFLYAGWMRKKELRLDTKQWQYWGGGICPFPQGVEFEVMLPDGSKEFVDTKSSLDWSHYKSSDPSRDIIAFRVIGLCDGWEYPE